MRRRAAARSSVCALLVACVGLAGCSNAVTLTRPEALEKRPRPVRVLLMPIDIELGEITAGGVTGAKADWTQSARQHVRAALERKLGERHVVLVPYRPPPADSPAAYRDDQLMKLHRAVVKTIMAYKLRTDAPLATKRGKFDWTLGKDAGLLREGSDADYALFVFIRDTYASAQQKALAMIWSALVLFPVLPGSGQVGYASLVDLDSGDIVWFNFINRTTGELREAAPAREAVDELLHGFPLL